MSKSYIKVMTNQERIDALFFLYCESKRSNHDVHDYIKRNGKNLDASTVDFFEMCRAEKRAEEHMLEKVARDLFDVDLWHMWLDAPQDIV